MDDDRFVSIPELGVTSPGLHSPARTDRAQRSVPTSAPQHPAAAAELAQLRKEIDARDRNAARVAEYARHLEAELRAKEQHISNLEEELRRARQELGRANALVAISAEQLTMSRYLMADRAHAVLRRIPLLYPALRAAAFRRRRHRAG